MAQAATHPQTRPPAGTRADPGLAALEELGAALTRRGHLTMILTGGFRPRLQILDRSAPGRHATVVCEGDATGDGWFWWAWADRIAPVGDLDLTAERIDSALRRNPGPADPAA